MMPFASSCSPRWAIGRCNQSSASRDMAIALVHREDRVDLHRGAKRETRTANGDAGMPSFLPKHFHDQLGGAVDHLRMIEETGRGVHKAVQAQTLHDAIEIAERGLGLSEDIERGKSRRLLALGEVKPSAERAGQCELPVFQRQLTCDKELAAQMQERDIIGDGEGDLWKGEVERLESCFDLSGHAVSSSDWSALRAEDHRPKSLRSQAERSPCPGALLVPRIAGLDRFSMRQNGAESEYGYCGVETGADTCGGGNACQ